ncbi:MAG: EamA family transporter [Alphaproteobacteria bacterium]|nr:EamA family transporter [Alphaproteobacteria bacterium]
MQPFLPSPLAAALLSLAAFQAWVLSDAFIKWGSATIATPQQMVIVGACAGLTVLVFALLRSGRASLRIASPRIIFTRSILACCAALSTVLGVTWLPLADFYTIIFAAPLITAAMGALWLREKTPRGVLLAILVGFAGVILAARYGIAPSEEGSWAGVIATAAGALFFAGQNVYTRFAHARESSMALAFYPDLLIVAVFGGLMLARGEPWAGDIEGLAATALAGVASGAGMMLMVASLRHGQAAIAGSFHYSQIAGGALLGWVVWSDVPAPATVAGATVIILAGLYVIWHQNRKAKRLIAAAP